MKVILFNLCLVFFFNATYAQQQQIGYNDGKQKLNGELWKPVTMNEKKAGILKALFEARVNPISYAIFLIISRKNRESILDEIAAEFIKAYNLNQGIQKATVVTTTPLTEELRKQFNDMVVSATGKKVQLAEKIDPNLIGGYVLTIEDRQVDASLRSRLNELKLQLTN